jgi:hypothetical protein
VTPLDVTIVPDDIAALTPKPKKSKKPAKAKSNA